MPGFQTTKSKYANETKPFFQAKNYEVKSTFKKADIITSQDAMKIIDGTASKNGGFGMDMKKSSII